MNAILKRIRNTNNNQSTFSKINLVVKSIIREWEPDLISLNHLFYTSAVISIELCGVKIKTTERNVPKNVLGRDAFRNK